MSPVYLFTLISCSVFAVYGALIAWYLRAWKSIPSFSSRIAGSGGSHRTRISVIIPARNEEQNILSCLDSLARQTYPKELYQVVVVDDHSTDRTAIAATTRAAELALPLDFISLADQNDI